MFIDAIKEGSNEKRNKQNRVILINQSSVEMVIFKSVTRKSKQNEIS